MRSPLFLTLLLFLGTSTISSAKPSYILTDQAEISMMTLGPYQPEIYSAFGHSAIHISDPGNGINWVFNYGVFDFDQENFFWNFARGKLLYQLGLSDYERFKNHYIRENRSIVEQYLNLTLTEKQALFDFLLENHKPENREYLYNYVYNNCATKLPEVLEKTFPDRIQFHYDFIEENITIRDLMDRYLAFQPWGDWIIDIGLGIQIDKVATPQEYLFLPDYVEKSLSKTTFQRDSLVVPLVKTVDRVYTPTPEDFKNSLFTPFNTFMVLFFVIGFITNRDFKREKRTHWIDVLLFTFVGILAWWCVFLWAGTDHLSKYNLNLLWAIPLHIPLIYLLKIKRFAPILSGYFLVAGIWYILLLVVWGVLPQPLHMALVPLVLTLILRSFNIYIDLKRGLKKANQRS